MSRLPWDKFYYSDFERATQHLSNDLVGVWMRILCRTWESPRTGYLLHPSGTPFTDEDCARLAHLSVDGWRQVKDELIRTGVCSVDKSGTLYNRRQVRDAESRSGSRIRKAEERSRKGEKPDKSLSNQQNCHSDVTPESQRCHREKLEVRSQKSDTAAIAAVVPAAAAQPAARLAELTPEEWAEPDPTVEAFDLVNRLMKLHPKPGNLQLAQQAAVQVLAGAVNMRGVLADIEAKHEAWRAYWADNPKQFRPMLHRWFQDGDYLHAPVPEPEPEKEEFQW